MNQKRKIGLTLWSIFLLLLGAFVLTQSSKKVTYIEYEKYGQVPNQILDMCDTHFQIEQDLKIPYQIFYGISLHMGTYGRDNNSRYEVIIKDKTADGTIANLEFNASHIRDNSDYKIFLGSPISVDNTHEFSITIKAKTFVNTENGIAFFADPTSEGKFYYNHSEQTGQLSMNVYGGNTNSFWFLFTLVCVMYGLTLGLYIGYLYFAQKPIKTNSIVQAGLLGILVFSLLTVFNKVKTFSDEVDNIIGGMLIEKGRLLYVDYYTQHTPFAYWLCAGFAKLGAESVQQFRLGYNSFIAILYIGLFLRHRTHFGAKKMALIPVLQITFGVFFATETIMILSDNIQTVCLIALFLEFLQYLKDEKLGWGRAFLVSLSIFGSFGSAFVSAYAIFAIVIGVLIKEISYWKNAKVGLGNLIKRYGKLLIVCALPFVIAFAYLVITHSFWAAYEQAFQFNTQVYPYYLEDGFGTNPFQPFLIGISNFIKVIPNAISNILENRNPTIAWIQIILVIVLLIQFLKLVGQKEYLKVSITFLVISFSFTRSNEPFHEITAWSLMLVALIIFLTEKDLSRNAYKISLTLSFILILSGYLVLEILFQEPITISDLEKQVIDNTSDGEEIFYDIFSQGSVYLIYKNRLPVNRLTFVLPWYMDWYELDVINDLKTHKPNLVLYDEDMKVWEISGYDDYLRKYLHENYEQTEESKKIWLLKP